MTHECNIVCNGIEYAPVKPAPKGTRAVVVIDRGWVFAGDVTKNPDGYIVLSRALHVFKWEGGFTKLISDAKAAPADLRPVSDVVIPEASVIFSVPVPDSWGL